MSVPLSEPARCVPQLVLHVCKAFMIDSIYTTPSVYLGDFKTKNRKDDLKQSLSLHPSPNLLHIFACYTIQSNTVQTSSSEGP